MGWVITVVPRVYTFYASTILFAVVGGKLLREGLRMSPDEENEELEEVTQVRQGTWSRTQVMWIVAEEVAHEFMDAAMARI